MENKIKALLLENSLSVFGVKIDEKLIQFQKTRKDVDGDMTLVVFPFVKILKSSPAIVGEDIGRFLKEELEEVESYNVVSGFLNLNLTNAFWKNELFKMTEDKNFGCAAALSGKMFMVEYSSPNTNKPLHLGHMRNIFLGYSVSEILKANGHEVVKTQIINDRGIHICKSMVAWEQFATKDASGKRETPETNGMKGDHFVGKYYIEFDKQVTLQGFEMTSQWKENNYSNSTIPEEAKEKLPGLFTAYEASEDDKKKEGIYRKIAAFAVPFAQLTKDASEMLLKWEANEPAARKLWETMNNWVYVGFDKTYNRMEVDFDKIYYESETFLIGKDHVTEGLEKGVFFKKDDGSVWVDLTDEGLDEKLVLRADGTAVYMTQDIGTAIDRFKDFPNLNGVIYTVGNEQDYHFQVLFLILKKLGYDWAKNCFHLSYGMVDLPDGKMKSREGRVVDADDLMEEVVSMAKESTKERGHLDGMTDAERESLYEMIGMGGLKYYLLKVDPQKRMKFNPDESIELNGNTGPFIQYAYARINSLMTKVELVNPEKEMAIDHAEKELIKQLSEFPVVIKEAGQNYSPALIANYTFELVKNYNSFYQAFSVMKEENIALKNARILISQNTGKVIHTAMRLLGINVPNRM
ncbi:arginine--tRNA ligase [Brumimicrobium glaciale]|jgi:arginyl-tRNA synthetase|uniref:Arginine--tRNA ligase n=1 Tax=Brumimicrobium glaciale TaxID=200475 RepID=A0A4V1WFF5_9FLAO|nr:arginine--tRNA ligase [Brumimicrobium glaciale]RYM33016.1 arginine--tRNA ligase [Brumimicrobium glaciale]